MPFASIEEARNYFDNDTSLDVVIHDNGTAIGFYLNGVQVEYKKFKQEGSGIILIEEWAQRWEEWDSQEFQQELHWLASGHVLEFDAVTRVAALLQVWESRTLIEAVRKELAALRQKNGY